MAYYGAADRLWSCSDRPCYFSRRVVGKNESHLLGARGAAENTKERTLQQRAGQGQGRIGPVRFVVLAARVATDHTGG